MLLIVCVENLSLCELNETTLLKLNNTKEIIVTTMTFSLSYDKIVR